MPSPARRQVIAVSAFLVVVLFFTTTFRIAVVKGISMLPTFHDGQIVLVNQLHVFTSPLKKGDVVLVQREGDRDTLIKRVAFLPGETLSNSDSLRFFRSREKFERVSTPPADDPFSYFQVQVPKGRIVILGDNPDVSEDSRAFGPVFLSDIMGRVVGAPPKR